MEVGLVRKIDIDQEMQQAYLDYAMSVIVSRALPDARDGLKPVHRRILYSMYDAGIRPGSPFRKCARVIGDVMGWFHPHSNDAIYDALVRLGQDHANRLYPLPRFPASHYIEINRHSPLALIFILASQAECCVNWSRISCHAYT